MWKGLLIAALALVGVGLLVAVLPSGSGSGPKVLTANTASAQCSGYLSNVHVTSMTCDGSTTGCTYGSTAQITGHVTSSGDIPRPMKVSATVEGVPIMSQQIDDICSTDVITYYSANYGSSSGSCPGAGLYNFQFTLTIPGNERGWYNAWLLPIPVKLHVKHEGGGSDFGTCSMRFNTSSASKVATGVSVSALGVAGLFASLYAKRRKERLATSASEADERATNFELVQDSAVV